MGPKDRTSIALLLTMLLGIMVILIGTEYLEVHTHQLFVAGCIFGCMLIDIAALLFVYLCGSDRT